MIVTFLFFILAAILIQKFLTGQPQQIAWIVLLVLLVLYLIGVFGLYDAPWTYRRARY